VPYLDDRHDVQRMGLRMIIDTPRRRGPPHQGGRADGDGFLRGLSLFRDDAPPRMLALSVDDDIGEGIT
jgi:hypothetical protein